MLRQAVADDNGPGAILDVADLAAPSVVEALLARTTHPFEAAGIEFVVSEQSKLLDQARDEAIADARRKADLYAKAAGGSLGKVVTITEEGAPLPPRPIAAMRAAAVPVAPGEQTLRAAVAVTYELAP